MKARAYEEYRWKIEYFFQISKNNFGEYGLTRDVYICSHSKKGGWIKGIKQQKLNNLF